MGPTAGGWSRKSRTCSHCRATRANGKGSALLPQCDLCSLAWRSGSETARYAAGVDRISVEHSRQGAGAIGVNRPRGKSGRRTIQERPRCGLFLRTQDYEHALASYRLSLRSERHNERAKAGAGWAAFELGRYPVAERYLQEAVA